MRICSRTSVAVLAFATASYWLATGLPANAQSHGGRDIQAAWAFQFAQYYVPYAIQSSVAYEPISSLNERRRKLDEKGYGLDAAYAVESAVENEDLKRHARDIFKRWRYEFGSDSILTCIDPSDSACQAEYQSRGRAFGSGPVFQVWSRARSSTGRGDDCNQVSIAFRGTVGGFLEGSWFSNANRFGSPYDDYYYQLRRNISGIMKEIRKLDCYKNSRPPQIVTTGHSLGGGLAQFVGLGTRRGDLQVAKVFAFNSSPVTGAHLLDPQVRQANAKRLTIDHIYETGDPLYYARHSAAQEFPKLASACDPLVREVEVKAARGTALRLHGMKLLATNLTDLSYNDGDPTTYRAPVTKVAGCDVRYFDEEGEAVASIARRRITSAAGRLVRNDDRVSKPRAYAIVGARTYALAGDRELLFTPLPRAE